jgi:hypothetical protein
MSHNALRNRLIDLAKKHLINEKVSEGNKKLDVFITILVSIGFLLLLCQMGYSRMTIIEL